MSLMAGCALIGFGSGLLAAALDINLLGSAGLSMVLVTFYFAVLGRSGS